MIKKLVVVLTILIWSASSLAQTTNGVGETTGGNTNTSTTTTPTQPSIHQNANKGQKSQNMAAMMNMAMAGIMFASCYSSQNYALCAMGALGLMQAEASGQSAGQSGDAALGSFSGGGIDGLNIPPGGGTIDKVNGTNAGFKAVDQKALDMLKKGGFGFSDGKLIGPNGPVDPEAFKSEEGMVAAGFSPGDAAGALATLKKATAEVMEKYGDVDKPSFVKMDYDGSGGGGGGSGGGGGGSERSFDYSSLFKTLSPEEKARMIAGKSTNLGGEPIGVKMDNIFDMVRRRYTNKRAVKNYFIEERK